MQKLSAQKLVNQLDAIDLKCKQLYAARDAIEDKLFDAIRTSKDGRLALPGDRVVTLKDNFIDSKTGLPRNVGFKLAAIKKYELKFEHAPQAGA